MRLTLPRLAVLAMAFAAPAHAEPPILATLPEAEMVITPLPAGARSMRDIEIRRLLRDRILLTAFAEFENVGPMTVDGRTSEIELFHADGKWRLPGHWVTWTVGRYRIARGEVCISYTDSGSARLIHRCRAFFRTPDGAVYTRATSANDVTLNAGEQPALRAWTEPFSWLRDNAPYGIDYGE